MKPQSKRSLFRLLSLAVISCLVFTACTPASDPEGLFGTPSNPGVIREGSWDYDLSEVPYHYGNACTTVSGSWVCDYGEKVLFIAGANPYMLYTYDKRTGKVETFCKDATCTHDGRSCPVFEITDLQLYNGKVYGTRNIVVSHDQFLGELTVLKNGRFETVLSGVNTAHFYQGHLYVMTHDGTFFKYPEGDFKNSITLKEDFPHSIHAYADDYYYFSPPPYSTVQRFHLNDPDTAETVAEDMSMTFRTDGEYLYYCDAENYHLIRCNLDGSDPIPLTQMAIQPSVNYDEEYLYFFGYDPTDRTQEINRQLFRLKRDLTAEPELMATVDFQPSCIYTVYQADVLLISAVRGGELVFYAINKDGTGLQELTLPV